MRDLRELGAYTGYEVTPGNAEAFRAGVCSGIWLYATWKDGKQYVGVRQRPLEVVLQETRDLPAPQPDEGDPIMECAERVVNQAAKLGAPGIFGVLSDVVRQCVENAEDDLSEKHQFECSGCGEDKWGDPALVYPPSRDSSDGLPTLFCSPCSRQYDRDPDALSLTEAEFVALLGLLPSSLSEKLDPTGRTAVAKIENAFTARRAQNRAERQAREEGGA